MGLDYIATSWSFQNDINLALKIKKVRPVAPIFDSRFVFGVFNAKMSFYG